MVQPGTVLLVGLPDGVAGVIGLAGMLVLVMMLIALGGFAYRSLTGGVEWPDETDQEDEVTRNVDDDTDWKYS